MQHFHSEPEPHSVYADANASQVNTGAPTSSFDAAEQRRLQESIEDYLDRVCHPLMDTLPYAARQELRQEIAQHLNALVQAYREIGYTPALATEKALDKFGPPHLVAQKWNPVTAREGQYKRIERWFAEQWQGMAATLALCGVAGLLGLMLRHPGALSPHRLTPRLHPAVVSVATLPTPARPLTYTMSVTTIDPAEITELVSQRAALGQARAELAQQRAALEQARAELIYAQAILAAQQNADSILAHSSRYTITSLEQKIPLEQQRVLEREADIAQAEAALESITSHMGQRGL